MDDDELKRIADRAASAARYGREGYFVTSLIEVCEEDVPALIAEIRSLNFQLGDIEDNTY